MNLLDIWYSQLPTEAIEKIHKKLLLKLNEDQKQFAKVLCKEEWDNSSVESKEWDFLLYYKEFSNQTTEDDFVLLYNELEVKANKTLSDPYFSMARFICKLF